MANIFRRFDMRLYDTIRERDVDAVRDQFVGFPSLQAKGIRAEILGSRA